MLRPATPLAIVFFIAFVILLLSTLSTPIVKAIPLASYDDYNYGVFGMCNTQTGVCTPLSIGYGMDASSGNHFSLSSTTRHSLSAILVIHPVAAFLILVCFALAIAAHFHSPSSSPRFLLGLLILTIPTMIVTLLAFLVDILLFVPHMQWGGWIVLAAVILIVASSVLTCAMRRTLVSRKARQKRIEENAEMSGENYYNNLAQTRMMADASAVSQHNTSSLPRADSPPPMMTGANGSYDKDSTQYASYEMRQTQSREGENGDDRVPLNPNRDPSIRSVGSGRRAPYGPGERPPPMPRPSMDSQGRPRRPSRDPYGNAMAYGDLPPPGMRRRPSQESMGSNASYGSRGRGRGPPRGYRGGGPPGRGGYGPPRGYGPRGAYRGGPPPQGYRGRGGPPPGMGGPPRGPPPPNYSGNDHPYYAVAGGVGAAAAVGAGAMAMRSQSREAEQRSQPPYDPYVAGPDLPIGQAIEMDERTGSMPGGQPGEPWVAPETFGLQDSDATGMQQGQGLEQSRQMEARSPTSEYSEHSYLPPRQQWGAMPEMPRAATASPARAMPPAQASSAVLPSPSAPRHARSGSEPYYEDVDPRFAVEEPSDDGFNRDSALPNALTPGGQINPASTPGAFVNQNVPGGFPTTPANNPRRTSGGYGFPAPGGISRMQPQYPQHDAGYLHPKYLSGGSMTPNDSGSGGEPSPIEGEDGQANSERASEASHFTSISERPVNPNWRPGSDSGSGVPPQRRQQDVILGGNPDFSIPGVGSGRQRAGSRAATAASNMGGGFTPGGRYPGDI